MDDRDGLEQATVGVANFRDVGGHRTDDDAWVRTGLLYRSTELSRLEAVDARAILALGVRTVYDLRTAEERAWQPETERLPDVIASVPVDVLGTSDGPNPASFARLLEDPAAAAEALGGDRGGAMFERRYRDFVRLPSARAAYGRFFREIAEGSVLPAIVHCTTGKDRTGWAVAVLLTALDVSRAAVLDDFLASNAAVGPAVQPMIDRFVAAGGDGALLAPLSGVRASYLAAAFDEVELAFGSMDGYLADGLGLDEGWRDRLRSTFLASEPAGRAGPRAGR
jgi:protein-tyrosine phosphatase